MKGTTPHGAGPATLAELEDLRRWQREPSVRAWFGGKVPYEKVEVADPHLNR